MAYESLLTLLRAIAAGSTITELRAATGLSRPSIYRVLREVGGLGVRVELAARRPVRVLDWGVIDPHRLLAAASPDTPPAPTPQPAPGENPSQP